MSLDLLILIHDDCSHVEYWALCCECVFSAADKANGLTTKITMLHFTSYMFRTHVSSAEFLPFFARRASALQCLCGLPNGLKRGGVAATNASGSGSFRAKIIMGECCAFLGVTPPTQPPATLLFGIYRSTTGGQGFTSASLCKNSGPLQSMTNTNLCKKR